jgi:DNA polymerase III delta prime subunit
MTSHSTIKGEVDLGVDSNQEPMSQGHSDISSLNASNESGITSLNHAVDTEVDEVRNSGGMTGVALEAKTDCGTAKMGNWRMYELDTGSETGSTNLLIEDEIDMEEADQDFALFLKLPLELRRMIWKEALPGPRVIDIHLTRGRWT